MLQYRFSFKSRDSNFEDIDNEERYSIPNDGFNSNSNGYIRQMKQSLLSESDFSTKFKKERDIII